jgi:glucosyl-3-phosphoglycerate synthase
MDFDQGKISRIHDFFMNLESMKERLEELKKKSPSGVIIPIIESDLQSSSLPRIIDELSKCNYLEKVFIALSAKEPENYEKTIKLAQRLKVPCDVIWCNKPEVALVLEELNKTGLDVAAPMGKGKDLWIAIGIASLELHTFALHDADIVSYTEALPTRLLYPIIEPKLDFFFSKGYYARVSESTGRMYGRVCRLFANPVIQALQEKVQYRSEFLRYLSSFKYILSGEIAIYSDLALNLRIPSDWGFEIGMLAELFRNASYKRICEVDLGFYDHKHKEVKKDELLQVAEDSLVCLLRTLTETDHVEVSEAFLQSLKIIYRRTAQDKIRQYHADAQCNNLNYDRHEEETSVDSLANIAIDAGQRYQITPTGTQLPDWMRTISAMPDVRERLRDAAIEK